MEVDGYPLLSSDQEDAVKAISNAKTPLRLMVQSLIQQKVIPMFLSLKIKNKLRQIIFKNESEEGKQLKVRLIISIISAAFASFLVSLWKRNS